jgi:hypothetical protein
MSPRRALEKSYQKRLDQARTALNLNRNDDNKFGYWLGQVEHFSRKLESL